MTDIVFHSSRNSQAGQGNSDLAQLTEGCEGCLSQVLEGFHECLLADEPTIEERKNGE